MIVELEQLIERLAATRRKSGRTQADIAAEMGVKQSWVSDIETGKAEPKLSTLQRYHRAVTGQQLTICVRRTIVIPNDPAWTSPHKRTDFCISA